MAQAFASVDLKKSPEEVWQVIGGFGSLPDWFSFIAKSELEEGGRVRKLATSDGETIVERLEAFDQRGRSYTYSTVEAPFPVRDYLSTLRVLAAPGGSRVEWSGQFLPVGVSDEQASGLFRGIYEDGLRALSGRLKS